MSVADGSIERLPNCGFFVAAALAASRFRDARVEDAATVQALSLVTKPQPIGQNQKEHD
jgi:hypothetical protein